MRHFKWTAIFVLIGSALGFSSCDKLNSRKHFTLDAYFSSYFNFNNGSLWKYRLINDTGVAETVEVRGYYRGKMVWDAFDQEFIQYDLISNADSVYKMRAVASENNIAEVSLLVKDTFFRIAAQWFYTSQVFSGVSGTGDTFTFRPIYVQGTDSYNDVIELRPAKPRLLKAVFLARGVGIIRKEMKSGKTYVLKSYHVQ